MHEVLISKEGVQTSSNPYLMDFAREVAVAPVGIYTTKVDYSSGDECFAFVTTSKETYLDLGRMEWNAQYRLAKLLEWEFDQMDDVEPMILDVPRNRFLVTQMKGVGVMTFVLSPSH